MSDVDTIVVDDATVRACLNNLAALEIIDPDYRNSLPTLGIEARVVGRALFLTSEVAPIGTKLAIISAPKGSLFGAIPTGRRPEALTRALRVILSAWESDMSLPTFWKPFHHNSYISFQTNARSSGIISRAYIDTNPRGTSNVFLFLVTDESHGDLSLLLPNYAPYDDAIRQWPAVLEKPPLPPEGDFQPLQTDFNLEGGVSFEVTRGRTFKEWSETYLTKTQLAFVAAKLDRSIRLRGAAGTGKTLALVIKFMKSCYDHIDRNETFKAVFLAHSFSTVELIETYIRSIDERNILDGKYDIKLTTLHALANDYLGYDMAGLHPISLDGQEGRELQHLLLTEIIQDFRKREWVRFRTQASASLVRHMELDINQPEFRGFVYDLMNEFACVIDAFGSKSLEERRARYFREKRLAWMMPLEGTDREVVLDLYARFRRELREMETISTDQMTSDFLGYLDSFRWDAKRQSDGFNFIFADELHLFNRQERLTLHLLTKDPETIPIVVMAYDPRQSPRDTFMDSPSEDGVSLAPSSWKDTKLGDIDSFEFLEVFRYTPEILAFLDCLDQAFPVEDFGTEWGGELGKSVLESGPKPELFEYDSTLELYRNVFSKAARLSNQARATKGRVAVLCVSFDTFKIYLEAGEFRRSFLAITSREEISSINLAGKRFIFSMPEYVAGLQFDTVILIDANAGEVEALGGGIGAKRRFVSTLYLGSSRAERILQIATNGDRGGSADVIKTALSTGTLRKIQV